MCLHGDKGQGGQGPGTGPASGDARSGEQALEVTKCLPNSKAPPYIIGHVLPEGGP